MDKVAVITGDIIGSTAIRRSKQKDKFPLLIKECLNEVRKTEKKTIKQPFEIFRGDSFQGVVTDVKRSVVIALKIKAGLIMRSGEIKRGVLDARISIGIGRINYQAKAIKESDGVAFHLSGKQLDEMKVKNDRLSITSDNNKINQHLELLSVLLGLITKRWTAQQAEVMYYLLNDKTQSAIAELLDVKQPSVFQRAFLGHKNELLKALDYFQLLSDSI